MKIDWSKAEKKLIPNDTEVEITVTKATFIAQSGASGQPVVNVQFNVTDPSEYQGVALFERRSLQPQALWAFKQMLVKLGAPSSMFEDEDVDIEKICTDIVGYRGRAVVKVEEYTNKDGEQVETNRIKTFIGQQTFDVFDNTPAATTKK
jgi:hypothetical protein